MQFRPSAWSKWRKLGVGAGLVLLWFLFSGSSGGVRGAASDLILSAVACTRTPETQYWRPVNGKPNLIQDVSITLDRDFSLLGVRPRVCYPNGLPSVCVCVCTAACR